uniref:SyrP-like protein n=1 Tax=uncultured bacterium esnapd18 TaxID=1366599 RepID=S5TN70_9BACT|nr:SyrP-like protein [uncultured bacterium esnapd18]
MADTLPVLTAPAAAPFDWLTGMRDDLVAMLPACGAVVLRGLPVGAAADAARVRDLLPWPKMAPTEYFAPRGQDRDGMLSALSWPADRPICPQNDQSYSLEFPGVLVTAYLKTAARGGEVLLSDTRRVLDALPAPLVERVRDHGWLMSRTFHERVGMSWQEAFRVDTHDALAARLDGERIAFRWGSDHELRTLRRRAGILRHPVTGDPCWFNHIAFLNEWSLVPEERDIYLEAFGSRGLNLNTFHGDGTPFGETEVKAINSVHDEVAVPVEVRPGDVLLVDNLLMAHGRRPYDGERALALSFASATRVADCAPTVTDLAVDIESW